MHSRTDLASGTGTTPSAEPAGRTWNLHSLEQSQKPCLTALTLGFMNELAKAAHMEEHEELSDEALSQIEQDKIEDDIASLDVGDGNTAPSPSQ